MVTIYGFNGCPYCAELKEILTNEGIEFRDVDIQLDENVEEFEKVRKISNADEVPIVKVGNQLLIPNVSFKSITEAAELTKKFLA
jgi:glutaredoxin